MNDFLSVFVGVPQSRYAALAILLAIVVVSLVILFGKDTIPISQRFGFIFLVFLVSLPGLALSLFQLTCIVTGAGLKNKRWWCSIYAWVLSAIMIFYAVLLVLAAVMSLTNPTEKPENKVTKKTPQEFAKSMNNANQITANAFNTPMSHAPSLSHFQDTQDNQYYQNNQIHQQNANPNMKMQTGPMYKPNPQSPPSVSSSYSEPSMSMSLSERFTDASNLQKNEQVAPFKIQGSVSLPGPYPGNDQVTLPPPPGYYSNEPQIPMPNTPIKESFYALA